MNDLRNCVDEVELELEQLASLLVVLAERIETIGQYVDPEKAAKLAADLAWIASERLALSIARLQRADLRAAA